MTGWALIGFAGLVLAVGLERLAELRVANRNVKISLARGGREYGAGHYPVMVVLHSALLVSCLVEAVIADRALQPALAVTMTLLVALAQGLRWWCIRTLGWRWNTRIIVSDLPLVESGPYRWLNHPNYVAVVLEVLALPLAAGAWITAITFGIANALLLRVRIRAENAALATVVGA